MNELKSRITAFAVILFMCAVFRFIIPEGNVKRTANITLTLFVLVFILSPFSKINTDTVRIDVPDFDVTLTDNGSDGYEYLISTAIDGVLKREEIEYSNLKINGKTDSDGVYILEGIEITLEKSDTERFLSLMGELDLERGIFTVEEA